MPARRPIITSNIQIAAERLQAGAQCWRRCSGRASHAHWWSRSGRVYRPIGADRCWSISRSVCAFHPAGWLAGWLRPVRPLGRLRGLRARRQSGQLAAELLPARVCRRRSKVGSLLLAYARARGCLRGWREPSAECQSGGRRSGLGAGALRNQRSARASLCVRSAGFTTCWLPTGWLAGRARLCASERSGLISVGRPARGCGCARLGRQI